MLYSDCCFFFTRDRVTCNIDVMLLSLDAGLPESRTARAFQLLIPFRNNIRIITYRGNARVAVVVVVAVAVAVVVVAVAVNVAVTAGRQPHPIKSANRTSK